MEEFKNLESSQKQRNVSLSIIIPVYNNEKTISLTLKKISEVLNPDFTNYEIIVINDGSSDNTLNVLRAKEKEISNLKIISYSKNMGKGYAVKSGMLTSLGNTVVYIDGDFDVSPNTLKNYILEVKDFDIVIASKYHPNSKVNVVSSRTFMSRTFNLIVKIFTGIKINDTQAGLKAGKGEVMRNFFNKMFINGYAFDVELLTLATIMKLKIKEMPIEINIDQKFKIKNALRMLLDVLWISYKYRIKRCVAF